MKAVKNLVLLIALLTFVTGCSGEKAPEYGDKKEDWKPSKPPEGWRGPGQPGAPAIPNSAATPPSQGK